MLSALVVGPFPVIILLLLVFHLSSISSATRTFSLRLSDHISISALLLSLCYCLVIVTRAKSSRKTLMSKKLVM